jgi:phosphoribosylformimino-5-aminoimidazole carboxamide ribotide isomerase
VSILPVIDLKGGLVVRGIGGRRDQYRPICSRLAADARPATVAAAFAETYGFRQVYLADLDAIAGAEPDWDSWEQIARCGLRLWVDAGVGGAARARAVLGFHAAERSLEAVIVGLESVGRLEALPELVNLLGGERAVFSIDLRDGQPLSQQPAWQGTTAQNVAERATEIGFRRLILLDVASVGSGGGPRVKHLCRDIRRAHADVQLVSGGGVRGIDDVHALIAAGCDAALVASALHDGRIPFSSLSQSARRGSPTPPRAADRRSP